MRCYGTEDVFLKKEAGSPLLTRLTTALLSIELARSAQNSIDEQQASDARAYEAERERKLEEMRLATDSFKTMEPSMVHVASIAAAAGADLAKEAGIGDFVSLAKSLGGKAISALNLKASTAARGAARLPGGLGLKGNLALGGAAAAGLWGGSKLINKATQVMGSAPHGPATYGGAVNGVGYVTPYGVNQFGQPQAGTSL